MEWTTNHSILSNNILVVFEWGKLEKLKLFKITWGKTNIISFNKKLYSYLSYSVEFTYCVANNRDCKKRRDELAHILNIIHS